MRAGVGYFGPRLTELPVALNAVLLSVLRVASHDVRHRFVLKSNNPACPVGEKNLNKIPQKAQ